MPVNRGQGQTTRWYQLCFVPTSADSSDDSDTQSVIFDSSTPTSTWQQLSFSPPESPTPPHPPNPEPEIDWRFPPPPPPPFQDWADIVFQHGRHQQPQSHKHVDVMNGISRVRISELHDNSHCPICMEEFKGGDRVGRLPCNHTYHSECITRWLNYYKETCPVCRLQVNGWEGQSGTFSIVDHSLDPEPEIPNVTDSSASDNSDDDYDSAYDDEFGDSHEDGNVVGSAS
ncbi:RING finger protein 11-like [Abrus precatorius]|uniref:RING finger protein 11-like n=1 Tax=Abrus precatorius TaxID=3816 RepID=A0A8B8MMA3_ABRPR|nr:RING finger protein 11-like [Abrus precatorius]